MARLGKFFEGTGDADKESTEKKRIKIPLYHDFGLKGADEEEITVPDRTAERRSAAQKLGDLIRGGSDVLGKMKEKLPDAPTKEDIGIATAIIGKVLQETKGDAANNMGRSVDYLSNEFKAVGIEISKKDALGIILAFKTGIPSGVAYLLKNYGFKIAKLSYRVGSDINEARKNRSNPDQAEIKNPQKKSLLRKTARSIANNPEVQDATKAAAQKAILHLSKKLAEKGRK